MRVEAHPALERALLGRPLQVADEPLAVDEVRELARPHRLDAERDRDMGLESTPILFTLPHAATAAPFRFLASNSSGLR